MVKAMSTTEALMFVASKALGSPEPEGDELTSMDQMQAFAREING